MNISYQQIKRLAKASVEAFEFFGNEVKHSNVLEAFASSLGFGNFNALSSYFKAKEAKLKKRPETIFDWAKKIPLAPGSSSNTESRYFTGDHAESNTELDKKFYLEGIGMSVYDLCVLYFKNTSEARRFYPNLEYFDHRSFSGHNVFSLFAGDVNEDLNTTPPLLILPHSRENSFNQRSFTPIFFDGTMNVVLFYDNIENFVVDLVAFIKDSEVRFDAAYRQYFVDMLLEANITMNSPRGERA